MPLRALKRHPRKTAAAAILVAVLAAAIWIGLRYLDTAKIPVWLHQIGEWLSTVHPALYVLALAVLPYVGMPVSILYIGAAGAYGTYWAIFWSALGLIFNLLVGYLIGSRALRGPLSRWMEKKGRRLPEVPAGEFGRLVALTRIIPGPPLIVQNLLLSMAGVPLGIYLLVSWPICVIYAAALVLTSGSLFEGNAGKFLLGAISVVALTLLTHIVKTIYETRKKRRAAVSSSPK